MVLSFIWSMTKGLVPWLLPQRVNDLLFDDLPSTLSHTQHRLISFILDLVTLRSQIDSIHQQNVLILTTLDQLIVKLQLMSDLVARYKDDMFEMEKRMLDLQEDKIISAIGSTIDDDGDINSEDFDEDERIIGGRGMIVSLNQTGTKTLAKSPVNSGKNAVQVLRK